MPSFLPSDPPTRVRTAYPSSRPISMPSDGPSSAPSSIPSMDLRPSPTYYPTEKPSSERTVAPSDIQSYKPSSLPSFLPTIRPRYPHSKFPISRPSTLPTNFPSPNPTTCGTSPALRNADIRNKLNLIKHFNEKAFEYKESPQSVALQWILEKDEWHACPYDTNLVQRFIIGLFYLSMQISIEELNASHECTWDNIVCDENMVIKEIAFGEKQRGCICAGAI